MDILLNAIAIAVLASVVMFVFFPVVGILCEDDFDSEGYIDEIKIGAIMTFGFVVVVSTMAFAFTSLAYVIGWSFSQLLS